MKTSQSSSVRPNLPDSKAGGVHKLPPELQKIVFDGVDDFPIRMDKAKEYREKLTEEFVLKHQENFVGGGLYFVNTHRSELHAVVCIILYSQSALHMLACS